MSNNKEMEFNYTEVLVYRSFTCPTKIPLVKGTAHENKKPFGTKIKVNTCTNFMLGRLKKKMEKSGFCNFTYIIVAVYFTTFECIETLVGHVMCLKELIAAAFESCELLRLLGLN